MKILVTGATGRVGSRLVPALLDAGHTVKIITRQQGEEATNWLLAKGATQATGDIMQPDSLKGLFSDIDAVIHLAAFFRSQDADMIHDVNVNGTKHIVEAAMKTNKEIRFIFASTNLVYTNDAAPARESDKVSPTRPYPASKVEAEQYLLKLHKEQNLDLRILRLAFVYGSGDPHLAESGALFERWQWHPAQRLHMIHHADIAQAIKLVVQTEGLGGEIYNLGDDAPMTAQEALYLAGQDVKLGDPKAPLQNPWDGLVDTSKIRSLGFRPFVTSLYAARDRGIL